MMGLLFVTLLACGVTSNTNQWSSAQPQLNNPEYTIDSALIPYIQSYPMLGPAYPILPPRQDGDSRKTVVLDLDETLVHCSTRKILRNADINLPGRGGYISCILRPFLTHFLETLANDYELIIYTAGAKAYADPVLNYIESLLPDVPVIFSHKLYLTECTRIQVNGRQIKVKDLRLLGRDMKTTVIIDNSPLATAYAVDNTIPIVDFFGDNDDEQLLLMIHWVERFFLNDDVRVSLALTYMMRQQIETDEYISASIRQREQVQERVTLDDMNRILNHAQNNNAVVKTDLNDSGMNENPDNQIQSHGLETKRTQIEENTESSAPNMAASLGGRMSVSSFGTIQERSDLDSSVEPAIKIRPSSSREFDSIPRSAASNQLIESQDLDEVVPMIVKVRTRKQLRLSSDTTIHLSSENQQGTQTVPDLTVLVDEQENIPLMARKGPRLVSWCRFTSCFESNNA